MITRREWLEALARLEEEYARAASGLGGARGYQRSLMEHVRQTKQSLVDHLSTDYTLDLQHEEE